MNKVETIKYVHLQNEVDTGIKLIKKGLAELQQISGSNDFYYAPIIFISNGFEKLMKCIICYYEKEKNGRFPNSRYIQDVGSAKNQNKGRGHNLFELLQEIIVISKKMYYGQSEATKKDLNFLLSDTQLHKIINILSDFAQGGRYYNLDKVTDGNSKFDDPEDKWMYLETEIATYEGILEDMVKNSKKNDEYYKIINLSLIVCLEKFARALSRLFTLSELGQEAKGCTGFVSNFLFMMDKDLGKKAYPLIIS